MATPVPFWGRVPEGVATRLAEGTSKLRPQDWESCGKLGVVKVIAPFGGAEQMVADLKAVHTGTVTCFGQVAVSIDVLADR